MCHLNGIYFATYLVLFNLQITAMSIEKKIQPEADSTISQSERDMLDKTLDADMTSDDLVLERAALDNRDEDGDLLNEQSSADDISGEDLDIPGSEADDADELIGEEDEENNGYSQADTA